MYNTDNHTGKAKPYIVCCCWSTNILIMNQYPNHFSVQIGIA